MFHQVETSVILNILRKLFLLPFIAKSIMVDLKIGAQDSVLRAFVLMLVKQSQFGFDLK